MHVIPDTLCFDKSLQVQRSFCFDFSILPLPFTHIYAFPSPGGFSYPEPKRQSQPSVFLQMAKKPIVVIEISSDDDDETPLRANVRRPAGTIRAIKTEKPAKPARPPEDLDCFILDFDPFASIDLSKKLVLDDDVDGAEEISIVSERGPVRATDENPDLDFVFVFF
ncbi:hypothetical protein ACLOJK_033967 [Asimina triloba]